MAPRFSWNSSVATLCILALLYVVGTGIIHTKLKFQPRMMKITYSVSEFSDGAEKYTFQRNGEFLSYGDALVIMASGEKSFTDMLTHIIVGNRAPALFWECISVTAKTVQTIPFEFVLIPTTRLASVSSDIVPFKEQCSTHNSTNPSSTITTFYNLNKDALLVVPCPIGENQYREPPAHMAHLVSFLRGESHVRTTEFWVAVASAMIETLKRSVISDEQGGNERFWLSTSGLGVSWLHVRIDTRPKYYNWLEFKSS